MRRRGEASRDSSGVCCMRIKFVQLSSQLYNVVVAQLSTVQYRVLYEVPGSSGEFCVTVCNDW